MVLLHTLLSQPCWLLVVCSIGRAVGIKVWREEEGKGVRIKGRKVQLCAWRTSRTDGVVTALLVHQIVQFSRLTSPAKNVQTHQW